MKFAYVAQCFQELEFEQSRIVMTKMLANLLEKSSDHEAKCLSYLSMGTLFPPYQDQQFNIAHKSMVNIIAELLDCSTATIEKHAKQVGDLGVVLHELWHGNDQGLTLLQVYDALIHLASISGSGSTEKRSAELIKILQKVDAVGAKFVVRIVTKTLRLGFSDMTFLDALSWMLRSDKSLSKELEEAYNICADLGLVAYKLKQDGIDGIKKMAIQVGIPIRPSAAERLKDPEEIIRKLGSCVAQPKLDGFRVQVHLKKSDSSVEVHFFSRNLIDMSNMFPELKAAIVQLPVTSLICEGEAIVYDQETETFLPFQQTVKRKRKHDIESASQEFPLRLYIFDLLYLNGRSYLNHTHAQRRAELVNLLHGSLSNVLYLIDEQHVSTAQELQKYFLLNIHAGLEGLVVKREDAVYQPGKRNFNWIKLKKESYGALIDTVDGVILGYYAGRGKRAKFGIGAFLLGIYDKKKDRFETIAKVGTGLTDDELKQLKHQCDARKLMQAPKNVECAKELFPDVWVQPEIVCTVQSEEITLSPVHTAGKTADHLGYALRFPRFIGYRNDKSVYDATDSDEIKQLYKKQTS